MVVFYIHSVLVVMALALYIPFGVIMRFLVPNFNSLFWELFVNTMYEHGKRSGGMNNFWRFNE